MTARCKQCGAKVHIRYTHGRKSKSKMTISHKYNHPIEKEERY